MKLSKITQNINDYLHIRVGWRIIKTGLAVAITILISGLFNRGPGTLAGLAAVFSLRSTMPTSLKFGIYRILGNTIGVVVAILIVLFGTYLGIYNNPVFTAFGAGVGVMIVIFICNLIKHDKSIILANASFLFVFLSTPVNDILSYGGDRIFDAVLGTVVALVVNGLLPQYVSEENE